MSRAHWNEDETFAPRKPSWCNRPLLSTKEEIERALKEATASLKGDIKGATATLERAFALAQKSGTPEDAVIVAEELARVLARRKLDAKAIVYARFASTAAGDRKNGFTTLAKTCELAATRRHATKPHGARVLFRAASTAFQRAAALTKDPEDKRWLLELAKDAAKQTQPPKA